MDLSLERDSSALGSLFQQIINDMKNTSPLWEDFVAKAGKLHTCLRAAIQAIAAYLDAFQKIADAATNSRGASKEIGTALTRVCLRHKAVETRLKTFTSAIMDCLVQPLQDRIEDWKRTVATIDKDHAKEYKRCRSELKKRSSDTLRLQKKARKGQTDGLQSLMDSHMQDVTQRRAELEEVEKKSLRAAMVEERLRYCSFVHMLQPVVHEECEVMSELGHLQEAMQSIALVTKEPTVLPQASEELIHDAKASINLYPESPGGGSGSQGGGCSNSLGSRKSSVCSISSMNSSGSSNSPGHHHYPRSLSQFVTPAIRLKPGESSDSGFSSSPALTTTQTSNATNQTANVSTWPPHSQDVVDTLPPTADRPHTISTAYEKGHQRPPLTVYTFQNPETIPESGTGLNNGSPANGQPSPGQTTPATQKSPAATLSRPPLPVRCSSLERPLSAQSNHRQGSGSNLLQRQCPSPIPAHITKELSAAHHAQQQQQQQQQQPPQTPPTYVNMSELANMAALKLTNHQQQQQQKSATPPLRQQSSIDSISSQHSNDSSGSHQLLQQQQPHLQQQQSSQSNHHSATATRSHSISSTASSLHSHPSIDSTVACSSLVGQHHHSTSTNTNTTSPSSGSSTPQNHYSPLLTNSPTSTAAGTPSGSSIGTGTGLGFVYQVSSPTPPASEVLKITEQAAAGTVSENGAEETDERSRASVLQKASMFEKAAAAAAISPPAPISVTSPAPVVAAPAVPAGGTSGGRRSEAEQQEMDKSFEDSIQALNNLIGELDSFQREIDEGKGKQQQMSNISNNNMTTSSQSSSDNNNLPAATIITTTTSGLIEPCAISNQTNSSGCGTDISDTTSDELVGEGDDGDARRRDLDRDRDLLGASDSELSRCYVSETSSLTGGLTAGGYENPTFAHFVANANRGEDAVSLASDSVCLGQPRHAYVDTCSDSGSAVVVIYDHQIPITPDIEFVKQNSEIVMLRTKDPQPHSLQLHEMRELQQLPANLTGSPDSSPDSAGGQAPPPPATATVAPAKQRLSSFRATSEQQLQLLGRGSPQRGGAAGGGGTRIARRSSINQAKPPPPVRRSSSVTPSPASVGQQHQYQPQQQQHHSYQLSSSSEHLPPPPAFMLDAHSMPNSPPPTAMPSSALKVSETVRALAAMRHQPASPVSLRRMQQQQQQQHLQQQQYLQQQQQQPLLQSVHNSPLTDDLSYDAYYDSYLDLHAYAQQQQQQQAQLYHSQLQQHHQPLQQPPLYQAPPPADATFRTSSPAAGGGGGGIYAQPKLVNSMSSFRTSSPSPNGHAHAHPLPPTQPKANPNLIAQLNARLNSKQQQHQPGVEGIYGNQQQQPGGGGESIYMRSGLSMSQPQQQQHNDGKSEQMQMQQQQQQQHRIYASFGTTSSSSPSSSSANSTTQPSSILTPAPSSFNALPHFPLSSSTSSLLSKVSSFSNSSPSASSSPMMAAANSHYQPPQPPTASSSGGGAVANNKDFGIYSSSFNKNSAAAPSPNMRQAHPHPQQHHQQQQHYTCPPPLEDPPPPPIYSAGSSATMPKKMARPHVGPPHSAYAAASATATLPKNMLQQQQQRLHHQQYQQPTGMGNGTGHVSSQRPQLPLPQQKLRAAQQQHLAEQQQHQHQLQQQHQQQLQQQHQRQPPIPSRHSSVQQKIFVSTNPFIQTTAVKFHSPSASPTCGSPVTGSGSGSGSLASIYATTARGSHAQQQHYYRDVAGGGNSNGGAAYYNHNAHHAHAHVPTHHPNYATSTNIEKTGSIRAKTKAEFLENLNAKLAKQGMSGRAFAVRNLINSKALMYQNPQNLSRPSAQYRRPPTYPSTTATTTATNATCCDEQC
ncbi:AF4/FMR2 family member lilli isoform X10 [Drosophila kikkawai]|uniref:AF4/FMR2 family member lilli isoform X10 n=1 Tax=Drosophila kikkawai TaxID=30033 RepID=A0ABM4G9X8_DROKI